MKNYVNLEELSYQNLLSIHAHRDALRLLLEMLVENEILKTRFENSAEVLISLLEFLLELIDQILE